MLRTTTIAVATALSFLSPLVHADPRSEFLLHCAGCHRPNGTGLPPDVPTLVDELGNLVRTQEGRDYLVRVPGSSQAPISDALLADVINWILTEFNAATLPKDFQPLTTDEVSKVRRDTLADPMRYREQLWGDSGKSY